MMLTDLHRASNCLPRKQALQLPHYRSSHDRPIVGTVCSQEDRELMSRGDSEEGNECFCMIGLSSDWKALNDAGRERSGKGAVAVSSQSDTFQCSKSVRTEGELNGCLRRESVHRSEALVDDWTRYAKPSSGKG
jgi:hypothetical protein